MLAPRLYVKQDRDRWPQLPNEKMEPKEDLEVVPTVGTHLRKVQERVLPWVQVPLPRLLTDVL